MDWQKGIASFSKSAASQVVRRLKWWLSAAGGSVFVSVYCFGEHIYWARVVLAFLLAFIGPLLGFVAIKCLVMKKSNLVNAALLATLTLFDVLLGFFSVFWSVQGWKSASIVLAFAIGGLFYNVWLMTFALKLERN